jgi:diguanylate cyclase (GGDEF)-like protein
MKRIEPTTEAPDNLLETIADENGLAIIITGESGSISKANNNSICEHLYSSEEFAPRCAAFCGRAFQMATEAQNPVPYQCHAGLDCLAVPLKTVKPQVAIVGRTFTKGENFEKATKRAFEGDWREFPQEEFFENVLINSSSKVLETAAKRLEKVFEAEKGKQGKEQKASVEQTANKDELTKLIEQFHQQPAAAAAAAVKPAAKKMSDESDEIAVWRSLFGSLFSLRYSEACLSIVKFLSKRYSLGSMAWLERKENRFESLFATGTLSGQQFKINIPANDKLLFDALESELSLELRERAGNAENGKPQTISLFPVSVGGEVQSALVVADEKMEDALKRRISRFCKTVASELEILRLREEVERRTRFSNAVERFNASLRNIDTEDFWANLMRVSAELMQAERSSLLVFDEKNNSLTVKAAVGATADRIRNKSDKIGERVARLVLQKGKPVVVGDVGTIGLPAAPSDWKYKTSSFISYPFNVGDRRVGVLNITDKADGLAYGEADLELLNAIAPQVAVLIDRAGLKSKAGEFEQLSVTDGLTGLLNRRYLEERMTEEIKRSNRYGYPMSFMMIDVDHFKSYNDTFGHAEGDKALKIVADCFRETLRSADIAARYGGEEFSILLPQTTVNEAETIAGRLREHIEAIEFPNRRITVSIGIAGCCLELNSTDELIVAADKALYEAKRKGRNSVQVYEKIEDEGDTGKK